MFLKVSEVSIKYIKMIKCKYIALFIIFYSSSLTKNTNVETLLLFEKKKFFIYKIDQRLVSLSLNSYSIRTKKKRKYLVSLRCNKLLKYFYLHYDPRNQSSR